MENKGIYIDGVDVSRCGELYNGCCCDNGSFYCKDQPNCKFKLEKRGYKLEQITEFTPRKELIETITHLRVLNAELESYNEQLKESQNIQIKESEILREHLKAKEHECEELKEKYLELKEQNGSYIVQLNTANEQLDQLKVENEELKMKNSILEDEYKILEDNLDSRTRDFEDVIDGYKQTLTEIKEIAKSYQRDIDKICGYCRRYDGAHACCMDDLNRYEYRTGTTEACNRFIESERFDINIVANKILQKISEVEND